MYIHVINYVAQSSTNFDDESDTYEEVLSAMRVNIGGIIGLEI